MSVTLPKAALTLGGQADQVVTARVEHALRAAAYPALRGIKVSTKGWTTVLHGRVPSYHMKQMAQAVAFGVLGCGESEAT